MASNIRQHEGEALTVSLVKMNVNKIVIVVGTTGTGKSTIINMLYNNDFNKKACEEPCAVGATACAVTKKPEWHFNSGDGKVYGDTVGLGDPSRSDLEIAQGIKNFIKLFSHGVHCIIIVAKFGRFSKQEHCNLKIISQIFDSPWISSCIMVLTHYDLDTDEESQQREIDKWRGDDQVINGFIRMIGKRNIILTDNSLGRYEVNNRPLRQQCLAKLNEFIDSRNTLVRIPLDLTEIWRMIVEMVFPTPGKNATGALFERVNTVFGYLKSNTVKTGMCPICLDVVELSNMAQTDCHHIFHLGCAATAIKNRGDPCPICRRSVHEICSVALVL